jgi:nucleoside-diphosphate-sugar epimerase
VRVVITGASGNVGTSVIQSLAGEDRVSSVLGLARRLPDWRPPKVEWAEADVVDTDLAPLFRGADCVVHLAWLIQPSRDEHMLDAVNVTGSDRVFRAAAEAGVPSLVYASSVGAYAAGPKDDLVDEGWPTTGIETSYYSRQKAATERLLDRLEAEHPELRVVRLRPGLIFKSEAAEEIRRLFAGPFLPSPLVRPDLIPLVPRIPGLRFQAVHSRDVGDAYRLAIVGDVRGAFNVAAEPVIGPRGLAALLGARTVPVPAGLARAATQALWRLRLIPTSPGWLDMALSVPLMDTRRAREELGWKPRHSASDALLELLEGMARRQGMDTPPLDPKTGGLMRGREVATGVGGRDR